MRAAWYETRGSARDVLVLGEMTDPEPADGEFVFAWPCRGSTLAM